MNASGKSTEDDPSAWAPAIHVGDHDGVPGAWLWTESTRVTEGMN